MSESAPAGPRILVVDDHPENLDLLRVLLRGNGFQVAEARHGAEALALARAAPPALVLSDLLMPVMDGYTLLRRWRADLALQRIPFLVYTATYTDQRDEELARQLGADAFLLKPVEPEALLQQLRAWLSRGVSAAEDGQALDPRQEEPLAAYNAALIRKLEDKMEESRLAQARLARVLENISEMIVLYGRDRRIVYVNDAVRRLSGRAPEEYLGRSCEEVAPPEVLDVYLPLLERAFAGDRTAAVLTQVAFVAGDPRWLQIQCKPILGTDGTVDEVVATTRDLTEAIARRQELERLDERLQKAIADTGIGLWEWEPATGQAWFSDSWGRLLGIEDPAVAMDYPTWRERIHPEDLEAVEADLAELLAGRRPKHEAEFRLRHEDGAYRRMFARATAVPGSAGQVRGTLLDVTERYELQMQLFEAQKMEALGRLAGGIAHDFNNLLTVILGSASLLELRGRTRGESGEETGRILRASERAAQLTRQLLLLSRKAVMQTRPLDLGELAQGLLKLMSRVLGEDVKVVMRFAPGLPQVTADPGMVEQALMNLLTNARDAIPEGGTIEVATSLERPAAGEAARDGSAAPADWVVLSVRDSGCGIPADLRERIFEPLFTTKEAGKGTGLGLAIARDLMRRHGGRIELRSEPGRGAEFRLCFPARQGAAEHEPEAAAAAPAPSGRERILVVEDDPTLRALIVETLAERGYAASGAESAASAQRTWDAAPQPFDLLLSDVVLPGGSGVELAERLAAVHPRLRVLLISGYPAENSRRLEEALAWARFLRKPFHPRELLDAVRATLD